MNVLSLFDGMSCGQLALDRLDRKVDRYYASEIDKYAIKVTQANFPNTQQLGNVQNILSKGSGGIDLLMGGSPCQGFSFAGKQLNFEDERSKLFFEYVRLLEDVRPTYFLLENVKMKKESQDVISKYLGVEPIKINSALVSAQNRERLYWTNIPGVTQPEDKGIFLKDIVEDGNDVIGGAFRGRYDKNGKAVQQLELRKDGKSNALTTVQKDTIIVDGIQWRNLTPLERERLQTVPDNYTNHVSKTQRYKMLGNGWTVDVIANILKGMKL